MGWENQPPSGQAILRANIMRPNHLTLPQKLAARLCTVWLDKTRAAT
jgi:hypothetical protein